MVRHRRKLENIALQDPYFQDRNLSANVDFYSAPLLYSLGIPVDTFTCMFAMSRIVGWTAHVFEQQANNRLIRPLANYHRRAPAAVRADRGTRVTSTSDPVLLLRKDGQLLAELRRGDGDQRLAPAGGSSCRTDRPRRTRSPRSARGCAW